MKTAVAIRHLPLEALAVFGDWLETDAATGATR